MKILIASLLFLIFSSLSAIHVYWGFGGKSAVAATIPTNQNNRPVINPSPFACFLVAAGLLVFGVFVLIKSGIIPLHLPNWLLNYGLWAMVALFLARAIGDFRHIGFFRKIKTTKFAQTDSKYYSPLCLLLAVLLIALNFTGN
jgi:hypothetical protein